MITLYQEVTTVTEIMAGSDGHYFNVPVKHTTSKPIKFPDTIFTYEGWTCDYVAKKMYRWRYTEREQVYYMDASLIDDTNNVPSPDDWLRTRGNKIVCTYYAETDWCPPTTKEKGNPSGHFDNVWLMSYQKEDDSEVYLYEFTYDNRDNILIQRSIEPRIHVNQPPGPGNILGEVVDINQNNNEENTDDPNAVSNDPENGGYDDSGDNNTTSTDDDNVPPIDTDNV